MKNPREVLRDVDVLRSRADQADKAASLLRPGVGLGLSIGSFEINDNIIVKEITDLLTERAAFWNSLADVLESTVLVVEPIVED